MSTNQVQGVKKLSIWWIRQVSAKVQQFLKETDEKILWIKKRNKTMLKLIKKYFGSKGSIKTNLYFKSCSRNIKRVILESGNEFKQLLSE